MTTARDPNLQKLFAQAAQDFQDDAFAADVLRQIDRERHRMLLVWFALIVVALMCLAFLASPVLAALGMATKALPVPLLEIAGAEIPAEMQGCSMLLLLKGEKPADWRTTETPRSTSSGC